MIEYKDFSKIDIRVGTIITAEINEFAKIPAYKLTIDFGDEIGIKTTSAQITEEYTTNELIGKQICAVVNFPPKQVAKVMSEVLVLGACKKSNVKLLITDKKCENGLKVE